ncbi:tetratricopeptide repeat protein [bacterium]|nr:tetratricopeptide repeat protein [bacterium]
MSLQLAEQFEANEQYEEAYREYKKEYESNPQDIGLLERLGHLSMILDKKDEAVVYYNEIIKRDVTNPLAYEQLISIYEGTDRYKYYIYRGNKNSIEGKLDFAINDFKKALSVATEGTQIAMTRMTLANLYVQAGNRLKAIDEFNMILEGDNLHEEMFLQLADLYMQDEAYSSAIDTLNRAIQKGFDTPRVNEGIAAVYLKSGNAQKALEYTKDELLKIQCMLELGQAAEAYEILNNLPEDLKHSPRYYTLMAQYYYSSKEFDKSLEAVEEYNKLAPNSPLTFQMRALVYEESGDEYNAHLNWGRYNILRKNVDIALNEFLNAVQINDSDVNLMFEIAELLTANKEIDHASEYYAKIVKKDPKNKEALYKLAQYREGLGDYGMQISYLEKIVDVDSNDLKALKELANAYEKNRMKSKALDIYRRYIELVKEPSEYKIVKDKIEKLETLGASDAQESEGLIDKIMKLFHK